KGHGRQNLIEGEVVDGQRVVVIEDLVSTGKSSLQAIQALRDAGCNVVGLVSIFSYGLEEAEENFKEAKCRFISLSNFEALLDFAFPDINFTVPTNEILEICLKILKNWMLSKY